MSQPTCIYSNPVDTGIGPGEPQSCDVTIPDFKLPSVKNLREHWAVKHRRTRAQRRLVQTVLNAMVKRGWITASQCLTVTLIRQAPRALDSDNLERALSAARDGTADWLARPGHDRDSALTAWCYQQRKGPEALIVHIDLRGQTASTEAA